MVLIGAALGAILAAGLLAVVAGIRGGPSPPMKPRRRATMPADRMLLGGAAALTAAIATFVLTGWPVGAGLGALAALTVPQILRQARTEEEAVTRTEAVAAWTEMLRDTLAGAAGLEETIRATAPAAPAPIRAEVARLARRLEHQSLVGSLEEFAEAVANPTADLVVVALSTAARHEVKELVGLLGALARSARDEAEMRRRIHVSRVRVRTSARVVTGTFLLFVIGLVVLNRSYLAPYDTMTGQLVLLVVGAIFASGWWLLQRMARMDEPDRFFAPVRGRETIR